MSNLINARQRFKDKIIEDKPTIQVKSRVYTVDFQTKLVKSYVEYYHGEKFNGDAWVVEAINLKLYKNRKVA